MYTYLQRLRALPIAAILTFAPLHHSAIALGQTVKTSPCAGDSSFQRLAFWVGDWEVLDSAGNHYANQLNRARVTIMPMGDGRVEQRFESSSDGGSTWRVVFKAEHRHRV